MLTIVYAGPVTKDTDFGFLTVPTGYGKGTEQVY